MRVSGSSASASDGAPDWLPWAKWTLEVTRAGNYSIYIRWPEGLAQTAAVRAEVNAGGYGYPPVAISQVNGGGQWHKLGRYWLDSGNSDTIKLLATGLGGAAEAARIVWETEP